MTQSSVSGYESKISESNKSSTSKEISSCSDKLRCKINGYEVVTTSLFYNDRCKIHDAVKDGTDYIIKFYKDDYKHLSDEISIHDKLKRSSDYSKYITPLVDIFDYRKYSSGTNKIKKYKALVFIKGTMDLHEYISKYITDKNKFSISNIDICVDVINCVEFIHSFDIIHIDIKPENIVIFKENGKYIPKLIDFEFARDLKGKFSFDSDRLNGTRGSTDPNIFNQLKYCDYAEYSIGTDTYSVGVVIYEIFANRRFKLPKLYRMGSNLMPDPNRADYRIQNILDSVLIYDLPANRSDLYTIKEELLALKSLCTKNTFASVVSSTVDMILKNESSKNEILNDGYITTPNVSEAKLI